MFKQFSIWKNRKIALVSHLTPKQYIAVARLVVKKCKVSCTLDGIPVGDESQLNLVGANGGAKPFEGWIEVSGVSAWL